MATKELIRTQYDDYTEKELLLYVNKKSKMSFIDLALAVTGLGTGVVGVYFRTSERKCPV